MRLPKPSALAEPRRDPGGSPGANPGEPRVDPGARAPAPVQERAPAPPGLARPGGGPERPCVACLREPTGLAESGRGGPLVLPDAAQADAWAFSAFPSRPLAATPLRSTTGPWCVHCAGRPASSSPPMRPHSCRHRPPGRHGLENAELYADSRRKVRDSRRCTSSVVPWPRPSISRIF